MAALPDFQRLEANLLHSAARGLGLETSASVTAIWGIRTLDADVRPLRSGQRRSLTIGPTVLRASLWERATLALRIRLITLPLSNALPKLPRAVTRSPALIVDADEALFRSRPRLEAFWRLAARGLASLSRGAGSLKSIKAAIDAEVVALAGDDPLPPVSDATLAAMRAHHAGGGRVVLVSNFSQTFVGGVGARLDCVDAAYGVEQHGGKLCAFLAQKFGDDGYVILASKRAPSLSLRVYARAIRTYQWSKNVLVFLPLLAAHDFTIAAWGAAVLAFIAFNLVASGVYLINDLFDMRADRGHPRKRNRPIASGEVPLDRAAYLAAGLGLGGLVIAAAGGLPLFAVVVCYLALTTAYSIRLKREPVVDVCILAGLYTMRIVAGGVAAGVVLSVWLLAFAMFIFLSLAAVKRQAELVDSRNGDRAQPQGRGYQIEDLPIVEMMAVTAGYVAVLVLALYLNTPAVVTLYQRPEFLWAVCAVLLYWISRAAMIAHRGEMDDDPIVFAFRDRVSHVCGVAVALALAAATWG